MRERENVLSSQPARTHTSGVVANTALPSPAPCDGNSGGMSGADGTGRSVATQPWTTSTTVVALAAAGVVGLLLRHQVRAVASACKLMALHGSPTASMLKVWRG